MFRIRVTHSWLVLVMLFCIMSSYGAETSVSAQTATQYGDQRALSLGPGDAISLQVYGQPDMKTDTYIGTDGTIPVPLVGKVAISGLSPNDAALRIGAALRDGNFLVNPNVTLTVTQSRSQLISIIGEVKNPGRFEIEANTPIYDALARAGGLTENAADEVYLLHTDAVGSTNKLSVSLRGLRQLSSSAPEQTLRGGDSIVVPKAEQFYIHGEVKTPGMYRIEPGMTLEQGLARAGGLTERGSGRRFELKRQDAAGNAKVSKVKPGEALRGNDVIRVMESIF